MKKAGIWTKDWSPGLAVAIVLFLFAGANLVPSRERKTYEIDVRVAERAPSDTIALIVIDDAASQATRTSER